MTATEQMRESAAKVAENIWDYGYSGKHGGEQAIRTAAAIRALPLPDVVPIDLTKFVNAANILASDMPHEVVAKLQAAMRAAQR